MGVAMTVAIIEDIWPVLDIVFKADGYMLVSMGLSALQRRYRSIRRTGRLRKEPRSSRLHARRIPEP